MFRNFAPRRFEKLQYNQGYDWASCVLNVGGAIALTNYIGIVFAKKKFMFGQGVLSSTQS